MLKTVTRLNGKKWGAFAAMGILTLSLITLPEHPANAAAAKAKSWSGSWNNRKFNTKGPLTCTVNSERGTTWSATFTGTGLGRPFRYPATFRVIEANGRKTIQGVSSVDGERYNWSGVISGKNLIGSYRSATGNNGAFSLVSK